MKRSYDNTIKDCQIINIPEIKFKNQKTICIDYRSELPFGVKRAYYLYGMPYGVTRGGHAHKRIYQFIIAAYGGFEIIIDDGADQETIKLDNPSQGVLLVPGIWRDLNKFSKKSVCLVLASELFIEEDYIRNYLEFLAFKNHG